MKIKVHFEEYKGQKYLTQMRPANGDTHVQHAKILSVEEQSRVQPVTPKAERGKDDDDAEQEPEEDGRAVTLAGADEKPNAARDGDHGERGVDDGKVRAGEGSLKSACLVAA